MDKKVNMLVEGWGEARATLLNGLTAKQQAILAPVLENQRALMLKEAAAAGSTDAHSIAGFRKVLIPMIRRIIPGTIAGELVGVQPMSGPVGLVFSMRFKYNDAVAAGGIAAGDEIFGNLPALTSYYSGGTNVDQVPGAGGFSLDVSDAQDGSVVAPGAITGTATGDAWQSSLGIGATTPHISRGGSGSYIEGSMGRGISLETVSQAVEAGSRKLQATWTLEAMQDANSQHGLDLENELTQTMSAHIVQEIDNEIITDLQVLAGTTSTWDGSLPGAPGYYTPTFAGDRFAGLGTHITWVANEIARKTRRGAGNFIVVSPMIVSVLQSAAKSVFAPAIEGSFKGPNNTMLVGTLNGTIKVYSYLWNQIQPTTATPAGTGNDTILVGYKGGNGEVDTGYFYCPYIPLVSTGVIMNPVTGQPVVSLMTRYGKATFTDNATSLGNSADYFGKIVTTGVSMA